MITIQMIMAKRPNVLQFSITLFVKLFWKSSRVSILTAACSLEGQFHIINMRSETFLPLGDLVGALVSVWRKTYSVGKIYWCSERKVNWKDLLDDFLISDQGCT